MGGEGGKVRPKIWRGVMEECWEWGIKGGWKILEIAGYCKALVRGYLVT